MALKVAVNKKEEGSFTVTLLGSLDTATYTILENAVEEILKTSPKVLIFDMSGVSYISSMGVSAILKTKKAVEEGNGKFFITNLQPQVKKVFDVLKALPSGIIFKNVEELDAYLWQIQKKELD